MKNGFGLGSSWNLTMNGSYTPTGRGALYARHPAVFAAPGELKAAAAGSITSRVGGSSGPGFVQITVNGALDPAAVARQIEELLRRNSIRVGAA